MTSVADPTGSNATVEETNRYDGGELVASEDGNFNVTQYEYDGLGRKVKTILPDGQRSFTQVEYDDDGSVVATIDENGNVTQYFYDSRNRLIQTVYADGTSTRQAWDSAGRVLVKIDAVGQASTTEYDAEDRVIKQISPAPGGDPTNDNDLMPMTVVTTYNDLGILSSADPTGTTNYERDEDGRPIAVTRYVMDGSTATIVSASSSTYDLDGNVLSTTVYDALGVPLTQVGLSSSTEQTTKYVYDGLDRKIAEIDPDPYEAGPLPSPDTQWTYDDSGNVVDTVQGVAESQGVLYSGDLIQNETVTEYDSLNRATLSATGRRTALASVDANGDVLFTLSANGFQSNDIVLIRYFRYVDNADGTVSQVRVQSEVHVSVIDGDTFTDQNNTIPSSVIVPGSVDVFTSTVSTQYDNDGNIVSTTDSHGNATTFEYDSRNRKITETDPAFEDDTLNYNTPVTSWTYDAAGNVLTVTDPRGNVTKYTYDDRSRRISQTLPGADNDPSKLDAPTTSYTYDADGRLLMTTDPLGRVSFTIYDNLGRSVASADGGSWALVSGSGTTVTVTLPQHGFNNLQYVEISAGAVGLPAGEYEVHWIDDDHFSITLANAAMVSGVAAITQFWTTTVYLQNGRVQNTTDMLRRVEEYGYDIAGNRNLVQSAFGTIDGAVISDTPDVMSTVTETFDSFGNVLTSTSPLGNVSGVDPALYTTTYTYDSLNRMLTEVGPEIDTNSADSQRTTTTWSYDALGHVIEVTQDGESTYTTYDVLNRPVVSASGVRSDAMATGGGSDNPTVTIVMDDHGFETGDEVFLFAAGGLWGGIHVITVIDADHFTFNVAPPIGTADANETPVSVAATFSITAYDVNGNVASVTDSRGFATSYTYDQENRKVSQSNSPSAGAAASVTSFSYDMDGNLVATTDALGKVTNYGYDNLNRKTSQQLPGTAAGTPVTYYSYDLAGNLATVTDPRGAVTSYGYDVLNRKVREQDADPDNNTATANTPVTTWTYDADGNLISTTSPLGNADLADAARYTTTYTYDNRNEQIRVSWVDADGSTIDSTSSTFDVAGNPSSTTDVFGYVTTYLYDGLNRKIDEREPSTTGVVGEGPLLVWAYDLHGNVISTQDALGREAFTVFDSSNRPIFSGQDCHVGAVSGSGHSVTVTLANHGFATGDRLMIAGNAGIPDGIYSVIVTGVNTFTFVVPGLDVSSIGGAVRVAGFTSAIVYDTNGNTIATTDAMGRTTTYVYDGMNRKTAMSLPSNVDGSRGPTTTYFYDLDSRIIGMVDPVGNTSADPAFQARHLTQTMYDADGNKTTVMGAYFSDSTNTVERPYTSYQYDLDGNVSAVIVYAAWGQATAGGPFEPVLGEATAYGYDMLDRKVVQVQSNPSTGGADVNDPATPKTFYTYDVAGNLTSVSDPRGSAVGSDPSEYLTTYIYDSQNRKVKQTVADADGNGTPAVTTYAYDAAGKLLSTVDPLGNVSGGTPALHETDYFYDAWGRKIAEEEPPALASDTDRATTWYIYDNNGNLTSTIDALGGQALGFAPSKDPTPAQMTAITAMVNGEQHTTSFVYDAENRKVAEIDADPDPSNDSTADVPVTTFGYDMAGELLWTTSPDGNTLGTTNLSDPAPGALYTTTYAYDPQGRKIMETDPDPDGTGPLQASVTRFGYDSNGNLIYTINPLGNVYLAANPTSLAAVVANHFDTDETVYDNDNRKIESDEADADGNPATSDTPRTLYQYDSAGNLTQLTDSDNNQTRYTYDRLNRQLSESLDVDKDGYNTPGYVNSSSVYDLDGNLISYTDHNGTVTSYVYNAANELIEQTAAEAGGVAPVVTEQSTYDVMGRLVSRQDSESVYSYTYDALGRQLSVTATLAGPSGPAAVGADLAAPILDNQTFSFDDGASLPAGDYRVEYVSGSVDYGDGQGQRVNGGGTFNIFYNGGNTTAPGTSATGLTAQQAEAASQGQFVIVHSDGGPIGLILNESVYTTYGRITAGSNGLPTFRLIALSPVAGSTPTSTYGTTYTYTYDVAGRQTGTSALFGSSLDHTEAFTYDDLGRLVMQTQDASGVAELKVTYVYDPNGQMLEVQRYAGGTAAIHSQYGYDDAGRLTHLRHSQGLGVGGANIDTYNLTYDADDRMTVFSSSSDGTAEYTYDANGQLTGTTGSAANPAGESYDYDPNGNRIVSDDLSGNESDIGPDNRILQSGDVSYTYDPNGNRLTSVNITTSNYSAKAGSGGMGAYDYRNLLTSITTTGPTPTDGSEQTQSNKRQETLVRRVRASRVNRWSCYFAVTLTTQ